MSGLDEHTLAAWRRADRASLTELGARLRACGLSPRALRYCFGVTCPGHAPMRAASRGPRRDPPAPAALAAHVFVAGDVVARSALDRVFGDDSARLLELGLLQIDGDRARATACILPVGPALIVSDRYDVAPDRDAALVADDSAYHTIGMLPDRAGRDLRWLDVGTGTGIVPLARPDAGAVILGTDLHPRALAMAELGAALSGIGHIEFAPSDLFDDIDAAPRWDRITFNAPIPAAAASGPWYRAGAPDILTRFWRQARSRLAPGGEALVHCHQPEADYPACLDVPGEVIAVRYTPPGHAPAFGVTLWRPDRPRAARLQHVALTGDMPHLDRQRVAPS